MNNANTPLVNASTTNTEAFRTSFPLPVTFTSITTSTSSQDSINLESTSSVADDFTLGALDSVNLMPSSAPLTDFSQVTSLRHSSTSKTTCTSASERRFTMTSSAVIPTSSLGSVSDFAGDMSSVSETTSVLTTNNQTNSSSISTASPLDSISYTTSSASSLTAGASDNASSLSRKQFPSKSFKTQTSATKASHSFASTSSDSTSSLASPAATSSTFRQTSGSPTVTTYHVTRMVSGVDETIVLYSTTYLTDSATSGLSQLSRNSASSGFETETKVAIGIVIPVTVILFLVSAVLIYFYRRRNQQATQVQAKSEVKRYSVYIYGTGSIHMSPKNKHNSSVAHNMF